ncbi:hypothetical protein [Mycolicibacter icosiumassiliensis]|uniref:hypothetical protein n=1 Tax=Mycolicibacter icosiumassiliensis TaxID=1792835 RepID=UPI000AA5E7D6|nr:hypothetical protein [Mycolicibacter icosiumassiliensis]
MDKEHAAVRLAYAATGGVVASFALSFVSEELALGFFVLAVLVGGAGIVVALSIARDSRVDVDEAHTVPMPPIPYDHQPLAYVPPPPPAATVAVEPHTDPVSVEPTDDGWGL